ncbi:MAG: GNAT family N-acetyltransferase [Pseudomonas marincola]
MQNQKINKIKVTKNEGQFTNWTSLLTLIQTSFKDMETRIDPPSSMHRLSEKSLREKANTETLFYVMSHGELVGCAFACIQEQVLYVGKVSILPDFQARGIGGLLMEACKNFAKQSAISELEIQTRIELTENHVFFGKLGFKQVGTTAHSGYDRPTSITMRCKV